MVPIDSAQIWPVRSTLSALLIEVMRRCWETIGIWLTSRTERVSSGPCSSQRASSSFHGATLVVTCSPGSSDLRLELTVPSIISSSTACGVTSECQPRSLLPSNAPRSPRNTEVRPAPIWIVSPSSRMPLTCPAIVTASGGCSRAGGGGRLVVSVSTNADTSVTCSRSVVRTLGSQGQTSRIETPARRTKSPLCHGTPPKWT